MVEIFILYQKILGHLSVTVTEEYLKGTVIAEVKIENAKCVYDRIVKILKMSNDQLKFEFNI